MTAQRRALFVAPSAPAPCATPALDRVGANYAEALAGVTRTEAAKEVFGVMPRGVVRGRRVVVEGVSTRTHAC